MPLEDSAVLESKCVVALRFGMGIQFFDLGDEELGMDQLVQDKLDGGAVVPAGKHCLRKAPHLCEARIELGDRAHLVDDILSI